MKHKTVAIVEGAAFICCTSIAVVLIGTSKEKAVSKTDIYTPAQYDCKDHLKVTDGRFTLDHSGKDCERVGLEDKGATTEFNMQINP